MGRYNIEQRIESIKETVLNTTIIPYGEIAQLEYRYNLQEKHAIFKRILIAVDQLCRRENIKYSLADGTLLGAIRHNAFIPWDDDADIMMTRPEFHKLQHAVSEDSTLKLFKIVFLDRISTEDAMDKGVFVDVFVIDDIPSNQIAHKLNILRSMFLRFSILTKETGIKYIKDKSGINKVLSRLIYAIAYGIGWLEKKIIGQRVYQLNDRIGEKRVTPSGYMTKYTSNWRELQRVFKQVWFNSYCDIVMCEYPFMMISAAEDYCINMFGNYNLLPKEEDRVPEHQVVTDFSNTDFRIYLGGA